MSVTTQQVENAKDAVRDAQEKLGETIEAIRAARQIGRDSGSYELKEVLEKLSLATAYLRPLWFANKLVSQLDALEVEDEEPPFDNLWPQQDTTDNRTPSVPSFD